MKRPRVLAAAAVLLAVIALLSVMVVAPESTRAGPVTCWGAQSRGRILLMVVLAVDDSSRRQEDRSYHPRARARGVRTLSRPSFQTT